MDVEYTRFKQVATGLGVESLARTEAAAVVGIGWLTVDVDRREDPEELALYNALAGHVCALAGLAPEPIQQEIEKRAGFDQEERARYIRAHADQLGQQPVRELAYAVAYILTISDLDLHPSESELMRALQVALGIDEAREHEIAGVVNEAITIE